MVTLQSQAEQIQEGIPHSLPQLPPAAPVLQWGGGYATIPPDTALEGKDLGKGMCAAVCGHWQHCDFVLCHRLVFHAPVSLVCFCSAVLIVGTQEQPTDLQASLDCMFVFCPKFFQVEAITFSMWTSLCEQTEQADNQRHSLLPRRELCKVLIY